eukprot:72254_1
MLTVLLLVICFQTHQALKRLSSDVQKQFIFKYLSGNETNQMREISNSMRHQINSIFPHRPALYALSKWISAINTTNRILSHLYHECERVGLRYNTPTVNNYTLCDIKLIEKVFVTIAMNDVLRSSADALCSIIAAMLGIDIKDYLSLSIMQNCMYLAAKDSIHCTRCTWRCSHTRLYEDELKKLFVFAVVEMNITQCKYNRYTQFALHFVDAIIRRWYNASDCFHDLKEELWASVPLEFVIDYTQKEALLFRRKSEIPPRIKDFLIANFWRSKSMYWLMMYPLRDPIKRCNVILWNSLEHHQSGDGFYKSLDMILENRLVNESQLIQRLRHLHKKHRHSLLLRGVRYLILNNDSETEEESDLKVRCSIGKCVHVNGNSSPCCDVM